MAHTRPDGWRKVPGGWDNLRCATRLPSSNRWGIPDLRPCHWRPPASAPLLPYTTRDDRGGRLAEGLCHFFLDDYRFESVWTRPALALARVRRFRATLAPDFSLYRDWPLVAQLYNTYRSRLVARTWQDQGLTVIPVASWSTEASWAFCFDGIPPGGTVALAVPDLRDRTTRALFRAGFAEMTRRLNPRLILSYGRLPFEHRQTRAYLPDWHRLRNL